MAALDDRRFGCFATVDGWSNRGVVIHWITRCATLGERKEHNVNRVTLCDSDAALAFLRVERLVSACKPEMGIWGKSAAVDSPCASRVAGIRTTAAPLKK